MSELVAVSSPALWIGFTVFVLLMLTLDLAVFHRQAHEVAFREAAGWSVVWIGLALLFNLGVYYWFGSERALEFLTGYVIEKALSIDNIFVFLVIFSYFAVPRALQHRVLFWGILGALVTRAFFIVVGAALLHRFHWVMYVFGAFLLVTGVKLLIKGDHEPHPERNPVFRLFRRFIPAVSEYHGQRFTVVKAGRRYATPLLLVLLTIEATDVVFAIDSIPAIFAVTRDPFIVFSSNIFAILGLRALFFLVAGMIGQFRYLKVGLALVLAFVGAKMLVVDFYKIPIGLSLSTVCALLGGSVLASLLIPLGRSRSDPRQAPAVSLVPAIPPADGYDTPSTPRSA